MGSEAPYHYTEGSPIVSAPQRTVHDYTNPIGSWMDVGEYRDFWFIWLWVASSSFLTYLNVSQYLKGSRPFDLSSDEDSNDDQSSAVYIHLGLVLGGCLLVAVLLTSFFLFLMKRFPVPLVYASGGFVAGYFLLSGVGLLFAQAYLGAALLIFAGAMVLFLICSRSSFIVFCAHCLSTSSTVCSRYWGVFVCTIAVGIASVGFVSFSTFTFFENGKLTVYASTPAYSIPLLLCLFWSEQVFSNIVHVTTSGTTADWFFSRGGPASPPQFLSQVNQGGSVTPAAFKRSVTTSFGSVCLGSLFIAIIQLLYHLVDQATRDGKHPIVRCLALCIMGMLKRLAEIFADYSFVHVAMFGKPFVRAALDTWNLVKEGRAWDAILGDCLVSYVFMALTFVGMLPCFLAGWGLAHVAGFSDTSMSVGGLSGVMVYLLVSRVVFRNIYSAIITIFVGFWHTRSEGAVWAIPDEQDESSKHIYEEFCVNYTPEKHPREQV